MKKFIIMILSVSVFFVGLGGLVDRVGAKFKSDERALAIVAQARTAIGGDAAIKNVRSLTIVGNAEQTFTIDGASRTEQGNLEINLQMPNQFSKMLKIGKESGGAAGEMRQENHVIITSKDDTNAVFHQDDADGNTKFVIMKKGDDANVISQNSEMPNAKRIVVNKNVAGDASHFRQNELFRTTFALLLSAPEGLDASYSYAGVETVDGTACDVILVDDSSSNFKLFIDQSSHLPVMMSYKAAIPIIFKFKKGEIENGDNQTKSVVINRDGSQTETGDKRVQVFTRKVDAPETLGEYQVKFSDYRNVGGVQLPYKWTQTVGGQPDQTIDVVSYDINPANIADKFNRMPQKIMIRTEKSQ